jgi:hypothetical protein
MYCYYSCHLQAHDSSVHAMCASFLRVRFNVISISGCRDLYIIIGGGGGDTIATRAQSGLTALLSAAEKGRADCVRLLLGAGADKEAKTNVRRVFDRMVMVAAMLANFLSFVQSISCLFSF